MARYVKQVIYSRHGNVSLLLGNALGELRLSLLTGQFRVSKDENLSITKASLVTSGETMDGIRLR